MRRIQTVYNLALSHRNENDPKPDLDVVKTTMRLFSSSLISPSTDMPKPHLFSDLTPILVTELSDMVLPSGKKNNFTLDVSSTR
ncbi:MAG: hypothetical protein AAF090_15270 [Bacteroidota bacterium]